MTALSKVFVKAACLPEEGGTDAKAGLYKEHFFATSGGGRDVCRSNIGAAMDIDPPKRKTADTSADNFKVRIKRRVTQGFQIIRSRRKWNDNREQGFFKDKMKIGEPNTTAT
jgi:hypothetical protein